MTPDREEFLAMPTTITDTELCPHHDLHHPCPREARLAALEKADHLRMGRDLAAAGTLATLQTQLAEASAWKIRQNSSLQHMSDRFDAFRDELRKEMKEDRDSFHAILDKTQAENTAQRSSMQRWLIGFLASALLSIALAGMNFMLSLSYRSVHP